MGPGHNTQVGPAACRIEIGFLRRKAQTVLLRYLILAKPVLRGTVIVVIVRVAAGFSGPDQQVKGLITIAQRRHIERAATGMEFILVACELAILGTPEIGQHVAIAPPGIAALRPSIIVGSLPANIEHRVDRRGTAKHLATRLFDSSVVAAGLRFGFEHPVDRRVDHRLDVACRNMDQRVAILAASLEKDH